ATVPRSWFKGRLGLAALLWVFWTACFVCCQRDLVNLVLGPIPLDRDTLFALRDPADLQMYHVRVQADQEQRFFPSAYTLGQEPYSYYSVLFLGEKRLLVHLPARHQGNVYSGLLEPFTPFEKDVVLDRCRAKHPGKELLPFRLNLT